MRRDRISYIINDRMGSSAGLRHWLRTFVGVEIDPEVLQAQIEIQNLKMLIQFIKENDYDRSEFYFPPTVEELEEYDEVSS